MLVNNIKYFLSGTNPFLWSVW